VSEGLELWPLFGSNTSRAPELRARQGLRAGRLEGLRVGRDRGES